MRPSAGGATWGEAALSLAAACFLVGGYLALEEARGGAFAALQGLREEATPVGGQPLEWRTDLGRAGVSLTEIVDGGAGRDEIPALEEPGFRSPGASPELHPREAVVAFSWRGDARAYPIRHLVWHPVVNDVVGGQPVLLVYNPFAAAAAAFDRMHRDQPLRFRVSGKLRLADPLPYDLQTESWWQGMGGTALVGELAGTELASLPVWLVSWQAFRESHPGGLVLQPPPGRLPYGHNPYLGQTWEERAPLRGEAPGLPAGAAVLGLRVGEAWVAYPLAYLQAAGALNDEVGGLPVAVFHAPGPADPRLGAPFAGGPPLGVAHAFRREVGERVLTFTPAAGAFLDRETGSRWNLLGRAVEGPLQGEELPPLPGLRLPWGLWWSLYPSTEIRTPGPVSGLPLARAAVSQVAR